MEDASDLMVLFREGDRPKLYRRENAPSGSLSKEDILEKMDEGQMDAESSKILKVSVSPLDSKEKSLERLWQTLMLAADDSEAIRKMKKFEPERTPLGKLKRPWLSRSNGKRSGKVFEITYLPDDDLMRRNFNSLNRQARNIFEGIMALGKKTLTEEEIVQGIAVMKERGKLESIQEPKRLWEYYRSTYKAIRMIKVVKW